MTFECIEVCGPELTEWSEPSVDLHQRFWADAVQAPLRIDARFDESRFAQDPKVFRYRGLRELEFVLDVAH